MRPLAVLVCALAAISCQFDTSGVAPDDAATTGGPDANDIDGAISIDASMIDAVAFDAIVPPDAAPPDATPFDAAPPPDADPCDSCNDGIACTNDICVGGICTPTDNCIVGTCNMTTEQCDATLVVREGLGGYAGTQDTFLRESMPLVNSGAALRFEWDADDPFDSDEMNAGLLRFDGIYGSGPTQIPSNATIASATLRLTIMDGSNGPEATTLHEVLVDWGENTVTWSDFGGESGIQNDERSAAVAMAPATACSGPCPATINIDVTSSVQSWQSSPADNFGWIFIPGADDGTEIASSEHSPANRRPQLTIVYSVPPPAVTP